MIITIKEQRNLYAQQKGAAQFRAVTNDDTCITVFLYINMMVGVHLCDERCPLLFHNSIKTYNRPVGKQKLKSQFYFTKYHLFLIFSYVCACLNSLKFQACSILNSLLE